MSKNILLISDQILKERTAVHGNIDPKLIYPDIKAAQDMYIKPALGTALYNKILTGVQNNSLSTDETFLLDEYIIDALVNYTLMELPIGISYQFWNKGVLRKTSENSDTPSMGELYDISNKYKNRAEFYREGLIRYLCENEQLYPEYMNPGTGVDVIKPKHNSYEMPIYLGDEEPKYKSFKDKYQ